MSSSTPFTRKNFKITCIGGGTGLSTIIKGLLKFPFVIRTITNATDSGGHSGSISYQLNIPPPGDSRQVLSTLLDNNSHLKSILDFRFQHGKWKGVSLGNLIISSAILSSGSTEKAMRHICSKFCSPHIVLPVSNSRTDICAKLLNGKIISGEWNVISKSKIDFLFHKKPINASHSVIELLKDADIITIGPGAFHTATISILLTAGVARAIRQSNAKKIFICNIMNQKNSFKFTTIDYLRELLKYLNSPIDYFLVNTGMPKKDLLKLYSKFGSFPVEIDFKQHYNVKLISGDFVERISVKEAISKYTRGVSNFPTLPHYIRHNSKKIAQVIYKIAIGVK